MTISSRTVILSETRERQVYLTSGSADYSDVWIQEPISQLFLNIDPFIIDGIFAHTNFPMIDETIEPDIHGEFVAWEAVSDEALFLFENKL